MDGPDNLDGRYYGDRHNFFNNFESNYYALAGRVWAGIMGDNTLNYITAKITLKAIINT